MSLVATKSEIAAVIALMNAPCDAKAQPWTEDTMSRAIINLVSELRENREQWFVVYALNPGVWGSEGPFATRDAAEKGAAKMPMLAHAKGVGVVPAYGPKFNRRREQEAVDKPPTVKLDAEVLLDQQAFRNGWKGNIRDRTKFLPVGT